jgi:putative hydroxymethylpyrimidine transport system substrate-binding protein
MRLMRQTVLFIAFLISGGLSYAPAARASVGDTYATAMQSASFVLDWYPNSDHGGLFTAMARGYFRRNHIAAVAHVPSDTSAQIRLVAAGKADFGFSYETDLLAARVHHVPVQSVMCIMQHPLNTVMTLRSSGITRPRQLVGKTVGMAGSPSDVPTVAAMMAHDGASIHRVRMVNVGYNLLPALLSKRVDAVVGVYWTWEAIIARQKGYPVNVMRVEKWGVPNYCELVLVASEKTVQTRKTYVREVVEALQEGYADAEAHPSVAWDALEGKASGLNRTLVMDSLKLLAPVVTDAPTIGYQSAAQWRRYAAWLVKNKLIDGPVNADAAFTNQFLRPAVR